MAPLGTPTRLHSRPIKCLLSPIRNIKIDTSAELSVQQAGQSLGVGSLSPDGSVTFSPSPKQDMKPNLKKSLSAPPAFDEEPSTGSGKLLSDPVFLRSQSSFLRVADLEMDETVHSNSTDEESFPNIHRAAADPPPGIALDPKERWIVLNDGDGTHAPIAPLAVKRLAHFGLTTSLDQRMWTPDAKTDRILKRAQGLTQSFQPSGCVQIQSGPEENEVLIWSGSFHHGFYGSELPAIRACGIVNMSARELMELLVDSSRVKEYNKISLGRQDLVCFQDSLEREGPFGRCIAKVMRSESKPPLLRRTLVFVSLLHAQELEDGSGYLIVTRAVHYPGEDEKSGNILKSEILMGVNLIRKVEGAEDSKCLMINVNHIRSPMVPIAVAKRIGVSAAIGFINDIRASAR